MNSRNDLIGTMLGSCRVESLIGRGGMGVVYLAQQMRPVRRVAVKVLLPNANLSPEVYQEFLLRFQREADVIAQLEHVNIMPIYEYGEQDGVAYLIMPYLTGGSLRDLLAKKGALTLSETLVYLEQAASALDYAHANHVIHRDLKPGNFLLHADGRLVLSDFGIARILQESNDPVGAALTATGVFLGTPEYMAPEMALGETIDARADIYELGIVLFQMLSGVVPFRATTPLAVVTKQIQEPLPSLHRMNPAIPPAVDSVLQVATAKKPGDRFATAGALAVALRNVLYAPGLSSFDREQHIPTVLSSQAPAALEIMAPGFETPVPTVPARAPGSDAIRAEPSSGGFSPTVSAYATPAPHAVKTGRSGRQLWLPFIALLLVIALVIGGVLVGLQLNRGTSPSPSGGSSPNGSLSTTAPTNAPTAPSVQTVIPTTAPPGVPTPVQNNQVPKGAVLYSASFPGAPCDQNGGQWVNYNNAVITCTSSGTQIGNHQGSLAGPLLIGLPSGAAFPSNYVIEAQLQQAPSSNVDFGLYFRNQPGNAQGIYTFLIHQDGAWSAYVYDNTTGEPTQIDSGGPVVDAHSLLTLDVVARGNTFSFYVNGGLLHSVNNATYPQGTVGIALDSGGSLLASSFVLYATQ